ncbi:protein LSM14 homolog car-1-like [Artemia franciscana]|uniref:Uncharacterized protein n=1 Tax=Artemia franciscana TaxID=6661 RepID=A0AA88IKI6_ARTSF|nr:hypothetical protein QYM36_002909 [Artemia franciscana]
MAAPAAGEQYIGSKIWLISKAEIRYEGILHSIDPNEARLALAYVQSYGTEDRPAEHVVAPREEIFELILFRASDIKDIRLCEAPKARPPPPERTAPIDPAIIQVQSSVPTGFPPSGLHHPGVMPPHIRPGPMMVHSYPGYSGPFAPGVGPGQNMMPPLPVPSIGQSTITFSGIGTDLGPVGPPPHPDGPSEEDLAAAPGASKSQASTPLPPSEPEVGSRKASESDSKGEEAISRGVSNGLRRDDYRRPTRGYYDGYNRNYYQRDYEDRRGGYRGRGYGGGRGGYDSRGGYEARNRGGYRDQMRDSPQNVGATPKPSGPTKLKFDQDFDFERANKDFEKMLQQLGKTTISDSASSKSSSESVKDNSEVRESTEEKNEVGTAAKAVSEQICYNKEKSFFDTISCEAIERNKGGYQKPDWQKEKMLNCETFGIKPRGASQRGYNSNYNYRGYSRGANNYRNNYSYDGYNRDYRDNYNYRGGYRSGGYSGGYDSRNRGRGDGSRGGYRGNRGGRNYDGHDDRTERIERSEGRSERGRGSYASRV